MLVETWPIARLKPYQRNARKITQKAIDKVARSLQEYGWRQPIVVDAHDVIIAGHARRLAALQLGWTECPVHVADNLTPAQVRAYRLMDNRSNDEVEFDLDLLGLELGELKGLELDLSLTGFDSRELDVLLRTPDERADEVPPLPASAVTRPGDLWLMGEHRLLCGDATRAEDVGRLLDGRKPFLMVTDPPYGVDYDANWRQEAARAGLLSLANRSVQPVLNDDQKDWSWAYGLFPGAVAYVWHASIFGSSVATNLLSRQFEIRSQIIWTKPTFAISRGHYHWQHEAAWYAVRKGQGAKWKGDHSQTTVWHVPVLNKGEDRTGHSTQKPVELSRRPILNHTEKGEGVYDPFLGSGSTLIAAQELERICYGLEIDPRYCDVIVQRWQTFTGKQATLENAHGATFEHVKEGRRLEGEDAIKEEILNAGGS